MCSKIGRLKIKLVVINVGESHEHTFLLKEANSVRKERFVCYENGDT